MKHLTVTALEKAMPAQATSLLVKQQQIALLNDIAELAAGVLAITVGASDLLKEMRN